MQDECRRKPGVMDGLGTSQNGRQSKDDPAPTRRRWWHLKPRHVPKVALSMTGKDPKAEVETTLSGATPTSSAVAPAIFWGTPWRSETLHNGEKAPREGSSPSLPPSVNSTDIVDGHHGSSPDLTASVRTFQFIDDREMTFGGAAVPIPIFCVLWRGAQLRHASSLRPAIAGLPLVSCFVATHRRCVEAKAGVVLHALARGAAARRRVRCLAPHARVVETHAMPFARDDAAAGTTLSGATPTSSAVAPAICWGALWRSETLHNGEKAPREGSSPSLPPSVKSTDIVDGHHGSSPDLTASVRTFQFIDDREMTFGGAAVPVPIFCVLWRGAQLRHASSLRPAIAGLPLVSCFVATHRRCVEAKAGVVLHALARGAAARRRVRCLAPHARVIETHAMPFARDDAAAGTTLPGETSISLPPEETSILTAVKQASPANAPANIERGSADLSVIIDTDASGDLSSASRLELEDGTVTGNSMPRHCEKEEAPSPKKASMAELEDGAMRRNSMPNHCDTDETPSPKKKRLSAAERFHQRKQRNILKKEQKFNERGGAKKSGHKVQAYSSDIWDDEMIGAGRGCASGGDSVGDDVSQGTATEHECMTEPVEPSISPPETTDAVLVGVAAKIGPGKKFKRFRGIKSPDLVCCTIGSKVPYQDARSVSVGSSIQGLSGGTPWLEPSGGFRSTAPSNMSPDVTARTAPTTEQAPHLAPTGGITPPPPLFSTGSGARASTPPAKLGCRGIYASSEAHLRWRRRCPGTRTRARQWQWRCNSARRRQVETANGVMSSAMTPPALPSTPGTSLKEDASKRKSLPLTMAKTLFRENNPKPAIRGVGKWLNGCCVEIDPDGNCFGTSWVVSTLLWAAQKHASLKSFIVQLKEADRPGGAFGSLGTKCRTYLETFITYVDGLEASWNGVKAAEEAACGNSIAVDVVRTFLGPLGAGYNPENEKGDEPLWLSLKWGVAIAARALDVWFAPSNLSRAHMDNLRALGQAVEFHPGTAHAIFQSALDAGDAVDTPMEDAVRPGRGLGVVVGMIVDELTPAGTRETQNFTQVLCSLTKDLCVPGIALLKRGLPHYDILATAGSPLAAALLTSFPLPELSGDDTRDLQVLKDQKKSQRVSTKAEVEAHCLPGEAGAQAKLFEGFKKAHEAKQLEAKKIEAAKLIEAKQDEAKKGEAQNARQRRKKGRERR